MNSKEESIYAMLVRVLAVLTNFASTLSSITAFSPLQSALQTSVTKIAALEELILYNTDGYNDLKVISKDKLLLLVMDTIRRIMAYGQTSNLLVLKNEIAANESELKRISDSKLKIFSQGVYDKAQVNLTALATFGVNATTQAALLAEINNFNNLITKPKLAQADLKSLREQQKDAFKDALSNLKNITAIVDIFKTSNKIFYSHFVSAKKLGQHHNKSFDVIMQVIDSITQLGIKNVSISFYKEEEYLSDGSNAKPVMVDKSATKGGLRIKTLEEGNYIVEAKFFGYHTKTEKISLNKGLTTNFLIKLEKTGNTEV